MDEEEFPAGPEVPGQAESRAARMELQRWLTERTELPAWFALWEDLVAERAPMVDKAGEALLNAKGEVRTRRRWDWRKALYIAWSSVPKGKREPRTLEQLVDLLGLSSSGTIRNWRAHDPGLAERIAALPKAMLLDHVVDVYDALVTVATMPDPRANPDRKLFFVLTGELDEKTSLVVTGPDAGPVAVNVDHGLSELSDEELGTLDRIAQRIAGAGNRAGAPASD
jgi:hypothetical protein